MALERIVVKEPDTPRISPEKFAELLGAEIVTDPEEIHQLRLRYGSLLSYFLFPRHLRNYQLNDKKE